MPRSFFSARDTLLQVPVWWKIIWLYLYIIRDPDLKKKKDKNI